VKVRQILRRGGCDRDGSGGRQWDCSRFCSTRASQFL
jgi:hypothetical protein